MSTGAAAGALEAAAAAAVVAAALLAPPKLKPPAAGALEVAGVLPAVPAKLNDGVEPAVAAAVGAPKVGVLAGAADAAGAPNVGAAVPALCALLLAPNKLGVAAGVEVAAEGAPNAGVLLPAAAPNPPKPENAGAVDAAGWDAAAAAAG